jgi:hypothetical protein
VVKWGVLLQLAGAYEIRSVIQVACLTPDENPVVLASELGEKPLDGRVLDHFRNIERISDLSGPNGPHIHVFAEPFVARSRRAYVRAAVVAIQAVRERPLAVLLDPDTGLAERLATSKHVRNTEVGEFWNALQPSDWLVLYQHASRQRTWLESRRAAFANAVADSRVYTFRAAHGARDVAFFAACRAASA